MPWRAKQTKKIFSSTQSSSIIFPECSNIHQHPPSHMSGSHGFLFMVVILEMHVRKNDATGAICCFYWIFDECFTSRIIFLVRDKQIFNALWLAQLLVEMDVFMWTTAFSVLWTKQADAH